MDRWWPLQNCPNVKDVSFVVLDEVTHLTVDPEMNSNEGEATMTVFFSLFSHWNDVQRVKVANISGWAGYSVYEYLVLYLDYLTRQWFCWKWTVTLILGATSLTRYSMPRFREAGTQRNSRTRPSSSLALPFEPQVSSRGGQSLVLGTLDLPRSHPRL